MPRSAAYRVRWSFIANNTKDVPGTLATDSLEFKSKDVSCVEMLV
jgi:hypothetical protein